MALGDPEHCFVELDLVPGAAPQDLVSRLAALSAAATTIALEAGTVAVGAGDGVRDALTRYTEPFTGAYYLVPSVDALRGFLPDGTGAAQRARSRPARPIRSRKLSQ